MDTVPEIDLAPFIDHSLLQPIATPQQVDQWCEEADRYHFATVCVLPHYVRQVAHILHHQKPTVCTVIGFPTGLNTSATKLYEAQEAVENGANELDVVINLASLKTGEINGFYQEIAEICQATNVIVKAIIETRLLTTDEIKLAAKLSMEAGVRYIKTNTGWYGGVTLADIRLLKEIVKDQIGIKASGGIKDYAQAVELIVAGATRIGTSRGVELVKASHT